MTPSDSARKTDVSVEIDAPADVVWNAIVEAEQLRRWFPIDARVRPGLGGSVWLSWGPPFEHEGVIAAWEPGKRFGYVEERPPCDPGATAGSAPAAEPVRLAIDFHLEVRGGKTIVRVVESGFGTGATWDDEIDATVQGWNWCLRALRHYVERHLGKPRAATWMLATPALSIADARARLTGPSGFAFAPGTPAALRAGDRYTMSAGAQRFEGRVLLGAPGHSLLVTAENLGDGLLFFELNRLSGTTTLGVLLSTFGEPTRATTAAHAAVRALFTKLFPAS